MKVKGLAALKSGGPLESYEFERRVTGPKDVAFKITHAGICHSDIHQVREEWGPALFPMVPGHEIVGLVTEVEARLANLKLEIASELVFLLTHVENANLAKRECRITVIKE